MSTPFVIDANSLIMRSIMASALDDLRAGKTFTGGVYGALTTLASLCSMPDIQPGAIYACFDGGIPPARMAALPDYKQARKERRKLFSDEDKERVFAQVGLARKLFGRLGIVCLKYKQREADDVVAAVVQVLRAQGPRPLVISGDRDLWQTVALGARVWDLNRRTLIDADNFADHAGVPLSHFLLYKALTGDSSDGIAGAPGVGSKRAVQLLEDHADALDADAGPDGQLSALLDALRALEKPRKFEQGIVEQAAYLRRVLSAIDLTKSFGKRRRLFEAVARRPDCALRPFLRFCRKLQFQSVLGNPQRFFRPFRQAYERRQGVDRKRVAR